MSDVYAAYAESIRLFLAEHGEASAGRLQYHIAAPQLSDIEQCLALMLEKGEIEQCGPEGSLIYCLSQGTFSMGTLYVYVCSQCEYTEVRQAGMLYPAQVPTHCERVMQMSQYQPQENDVCTQGEESGIFALYCFDGTKWNLAVKLPRGETEQTVGSMHFLFEHKGKRCYRPLAVSPDPFEGMTHADFVAALDPESWTEGPTVLSTPTFEARLHTDGTLWLSGAALHEGFSVDAATALARFLSERVKFPPQDSPVKPKQIYLSEVAWRILAILEETDDQDVGRSLPFLAGNLREMIRRTSHSTLSASGNVTRLIEEAVSELMQAGLIEKLPDQERYRLVRRRPLS